MTRLIFSRRPNCPESTDTMSYKRRVGYYELFASSERSCDVFAPEDLQVAPLTHINLAFVNFDSSFQLIDNYGPLISRVTFLKLRYPAVRVNIAVGGWTFNDQPTQQHFSNMASTHDNRQTFIKSLVFFLQKYGLDGVDIDWEYPVADDRGGSPQDRSNYVELMAEIRQAFDQHNPGWEATITVPTSYWYLRGFDLEGLQKYISFFNVMSYDLHGMWDHDNRFTGPYLKGHTNITEINLGLDLLWRNNIKPENVVMGFAFYGRSFTLANSACTTPNGCQFSTSGNPGTCTATGGILSYNEISSRNHSLDVQTFYDPIATVKYNVYEGNQWVSYDDAQSFDDKKKFLSSLCLSGVMIWAIDQDTRNFDAMNGLMGDYSGSQWEGGGLDENAAKGLSSAFGAYTGQNCFITPTCTDGTDSQKQTDQVCPGGTMSVATAHAPLQAPGHDLHGTCAKGWYRHVCCPSNAM
jgi:GH18 family chitinase